MKSNIFAYSSPGGRYPGYVSVNRREDGDVEVTVRSAPTVYEGVTVCSHEESLGRCTPGGPTCNNYCNLAPAKGPVQESPLPWTHTREGNSASFVVPATEWARMGGQL